MSNEPSSSSKSSCVGNGISDSSSVDTVWMSSWVRKMKNEIRSTLGSALKKLRSARSSHDGRPTTWSTRVLSRVTRMTKARALFCGTDSSGSTGTLTS